MTSDASGALAGVTVVVTRPIERADDLASLFAGLGAQVIVMPLIEIVSMEAGAEITAELGSLNGDDWVIAVSTAAASEISPPLVDSLAKVAAVGATTAQHLPRVDLVAPTQSALGLLSVFPRCSIAAGRVVVAQARDGEPTLTEGLTALGWNVTRIDTHFSRSVVPTLQQQMSVLRADVLALTSGTQARAWVEVFGTAAPTLVATIGPQTAQNAESRGLKVHLIATDHTLTGLVAAVQDSLGAH